MSNVPAAAKAVHDYRNEHGITAPIVEIDWTGVYWIKLTVNGRIDIKKMYVLK